MCDCRGLIIVVAFVTFAGVSCSSESERSGKSKESALSCGGRPCNVVQMSSLLSSDSKTRHFTVYSQTPTEYIQLFDSLGVRESKRHWSNVELNYGICQLYVILEVKSVEGEGWSFVNISPSCVSNGVESDKILDTQEEREKLKRALQQRVCEFMGCPSSVGKELE